MAGDDFSPKVRANLAKRAAFQCCLCGASTVGPSRESPASVTNIGVAAHIAGARPGSARYDAEMTSVQRAGIQNGIWLCQTHAKAVDDDEVTWPVRQLLKEKEAHEERIIAAIGVARKRVAMAAPARGESGIVAQEFGFLRVGDLLPAYRAFLKPILDDHHLGDTTELGVLMCSLPTVHGPDGARLPWTVLVRPDWLRQALAEQSKALGSKGEIPDKAIYGRVPGWPDEFLEFFAAIVQTGVTFRWQRTPQGHLALGQ